jgi:hypothetical protein
VTDAIQLEPCLNCHGKMWVEDGNGDWVRCLECNPEPPKAQVLTFVRGARVRKPVVDNGPEAA